MRTRLNKLNLTKLTEDFIAKCCIENCRYIGFTDPRFEENMFYIFGRDCRKITEEEYNAVITEIEDNLSEVKQFLLELNLITPEELRFLIDEEETLNGGFPEPTKEVN